MTEEELVASANGLPIERRPAFPIYKQVENLMKTRVSVHYFPGRIIASQDIQFYIDTNPDGFLSMLGANDCLWVPLYRGIPSFDTDKHGRGAAEKVPQFRRNVGFAVEAARVVHRIIVGNAGVETWCWHPDIRKEQGDFVSRFLRESSDELRGFGIEPMYAYAETHHDCYMREWKVRDTLMELDLIQFSPMAYEMFRRKDPPEYPPYPYMQRYLEGTRIWSGVDFEQGLRDGNDKFLKALGFEAGVMGVSQDVGGY